MHYDLLSNKIGAFVTVLSDIVTSPQSSPSSDAALVTLLHRQPISVTSLAGILGLSQPATSRLVQRLQDKNLAEQQPASGRERALALTRQGKTTATSLQRKRLKAIEEAIEPLNDGDREVLDRIVSIILANLVEGPEHARHLCRHCDHETCSGALCPVGSEIRRRSGEEDTHDSGT